MTNFRLVTMTFLCHIALGPLALFAEDVAKKTNDELWQQADARIEQHRKTEVTIQVTDAEGKPIPDANVRLEQTDHAFLFGSNIFSWRIPEQPQREVQYRERFAKLLNFATAGFYWPSYEYKQGETKFEQTMAVARWCAENGITLKGHPLAWNYSDPHWLPHDSDAIFELQQQRIADCVTRFRGSIDVWDVVNEATHFDREEFFERSPKMSRMWADHGQIEFTTACFMTARKAAPQATLLVNDYRTDQAFAEVISKLVDSDGKRLYDAIGIQSHQHGGTWDNQSIWEVCERFSQFGVPLHFTEVTILSGERKWRPDEDHSPWPSTAQGEAYQDREVERFYTMLYSHPAVEAITWWDFSDFNSWKHAPSGLVRDDMSPKPAYETLMKLIHGKWWTDEQLTTDQNGKATCRATFGDYRVTVDSGQNRLAVTDAVVRRGGNGRIEIQLQAN